MLMCWESFCVFFFFFTRDIDSEIREQCALVVIQFVMYVPEKASCQIVGVQSAVFDRLSTSLA